VPNSGAAEISADSSAAAAVFIEKAAVQVSAPNTLILSAASEAPIWRLTFFIFFSTLCVQLLFTPTLVHFPGRYRHLQSSKRHFDFTPKSVGRLDGGEAERFRGC
jgi:hypothetical protein